MPSPGDQASSHCWECDDPTDRPVTLTLRTRRRAVATLVLCARCYCTYYVPLAEPDRLDRTLLVEPNDST